MVENTEKTETPQVSAPKPTEYKPAERPKKVERPQRNPRYNKKSKFLFKKKYCFFCSNKDKELDYKDVGLLRRFVAESFKISPRRFTGTCAKHQRKLSTEIKKARLMALLPYTDKHK
jgi:small subunit ribosomal protein S18